MRRSRGEIFRMLGQNDARIQQFGVKKLGLFGSAVRGENSEASDLDFVVEFEKKSFDAYMGLKLFLEDLFACSVDLVLEDSIKPRLRSIILRETLYAPGP